METLAFIINYNRLTLPRRMADYLSECDGIRPIIIDNGSDYPPLLEYYESTKHEVVKLGANYGCTVVWHPESGVSERFGLRTIGRYIVTDPDLDLSRIPKDFLRLLNGGLDKYKWAAKAGFSLEINDIPEGFLKEEIMKWEADKWISPLDTQFYSAYIDTTFCLCRGFVHDFPAVRTNRPYTARHVPWYYTPDNIPDDEKYYLESAGKWSTFSRKWREIYAS